MTRTFAVGALAAALVIGVGIIAAVALGSESWAIALLGLLVVGVCGALLEVGRRHPDLMAAAARVPRELNTDIRGLVRSAEGSLERTKRMQGDIRKIQGDVRKIQGDVRKSQRSTRLLARSGSRSLERSRRMEHEIDTLAAEAARNAAAQRRIIAAVETERLAAAEREQVVISKIEEAGARLLTPRRGHDLFHDMRTFLPNLDIEMIFDVGAHVGESTREFRSRFPEARIHSFEPIRETFLQLEAAVAGDQLTRAYRVGLSDRDRAATMVVEESDSAHAVVLAADGGEARGEAVQLKTLDSFCEEQGVPQIDLLKVDTEGHDLKVVQGAAGMLSRERVGLVQVEAGLNPENDLHVPLEALRAELEKHGYRLFGFYEQVGEWPTQGPQLRRTNAVFLARTLISASPAVPARL